MLGNLSADLQIAVAQPIRVDDAVVVEGEWTRVEILTPNGDGRPTPPALAVGAGWR